MIEDNLLVIIILSVLIFVFEHKIVPTLIIMVLSAYKFREIITTNISETEILIAFAYVLLIFYAAYMLFVPTVAIREERYD